MFYKNRPLVVNELLVDTISPYQRIQLMKSPKDGVVLFLNGEVQFIESQEKRYHDILATYPLRKVSNVLILGGGDGLAARNVMGISKGDVYLCELDPLMIKVCSWHPEMVRLNKNSLSGVNVVLGDAKYTIKSFPNKYFDAVIMDFPDNKLDTMDLYGDGMLGEVNRVLSNNGIISAYSGGDSVNFLPRMFSWFHKLKIYPVDLGCMGRVEIISGIKRGLYV